jgi:hypothetical protein
MHTRVCVCVCPEVIREARSDRAKKRREDSKDFKKQCDMLLKSLQPPLPRGVGSFVASVVCSDANDEPTRVLAFEDGRTPSATCPWAGKVGTTASTRVNRVFAPWGETCMQKIVQKCETQVGQAGHSHGFARLPRPKAGTQSCVSVSTSAWLASIDGSEEDQRFGQVFGTPTENLDLVVPFHLFMGPSCFVGSIVEFPVSCVPSFMVVTKGTVHMMMFHFTLFGTSTMLEYFTATTWAKAKRVVDSAGHKVVSFLAETGTTVFQPLGFYTLVLNASTTHAAQIALVPHVTDATLINAGSDNLAALTGVLVGLRDAAQASAQAPTAALLEQTIASLEHVPHLG